MVTIATALYCHNSADYFQCDFPVRSSSVKTTSIQTLSASELTLIIEVGPSRPQRPFSICRDIQLEKEGTNMT